jgi:hypothetical protein
MGLLRFMYVMCQLDENITPLLSVFGSVAKNGAETLMELTFFDVQLLRLPHEAKTKVVVHSAGQTGRTKGASHPGRFSVPETSTNDTLSA